MMAAHGHQQKQQHASQTREQISSRAHQQHPPAHQQQLQQKIERQQQQLGLLYHSSGCTAPENCIHSTACSNAKEVLRHFKDGTEPARTSEGRL